MTSADTGPLATAPSGSRNSPTCPICGTPRAAFYSLGSDRLFAVAPGSFRLFRCGSCRCIFQSPIPGEEELGRFYPDDYWWSGKGPGNGIAGWIRKLEQMYREFVIRDHVRFLLRCAGNCSAKTLLDVGCGSGSFLKSAARHGFVCFGMDRSARAVEAAGNEFEIRQGGIGSEIWSGRRFDFISLHHVIEHLTDPGAALLYVRGLLAERGTLIVQVPNVSSIQARVFGRRWYGLDVPRHVINYTPEGLKTILRETGFEVTSSARFSLRDNPASIASSLLPGLDPIGRRSRRLRSGPVASALLEFFYLGVFLLSIPPAFIEGLVGRGGTIWVSARRCPD